MIHAALLLLMLEAVYGPRFTISLKRSTQNLPLSTSSPGRLPHLLALSGHCVRDIQCPLSGVKRSWRLHCEMSANANDPKRTSLVALHMSALGGKADMAIAPRDVR